MDQPLRRQPILPLIMMPTPPQFSCAKGVLPEPSITEDVAAVYRPLAPMQFSPQQEAAAQLQRGAEVEMALELATDMLVSAGAQRAAQMVRDLMLGIRQERHALTQRLRAEGQAAQERGLWGRPKEYRRAAAMVEKPSTIQQEAQAVLDQVVAQEMQARTGQAGAADAAPAQPQQAAQAAPVATATIGMPHTEREEAVAGVVRAIRVMEAMAARQGSMAAGVAVRAGLTAGPA